MKFEKLPPDLRFPKPFLWGASTASYQIEGNNLRSDFWDWERKRGWERSGACANSWELWRKDVECLKELGANAYRFSIEWSRIQPEPGVVDEEALRRYEQWLSALNEAGIKPIICLHHWSQPAWFWREHPKGFRDEKGVAAFLKFVETVVQAFKGNADDWMIFNEPMVQLVHRHVSGYFPPGERSLLRLDMNPLSLREAVIGTAQAHRRSYELIKRLAGKHHRVGIAHNVAHVEPARDVPDDAKAALQWDQFFHWNFLDGLVHGRMDLDLDGVPETILGEGSTLDYVGINYYTRVFCRHLPLRGEMKAVPLYFELGPMLGRLEPILWWLGATKADRPRDDMGREIYPEGLLSVLRAAYARYKLPVMVTENGLPDEGNKLREVYLLGHLMQLAKAAQEMPVLGYLYWSLVDNYEWGTFKPRFGLFRVDYKDGFKRELTEGGKLYRELIRAWKQDGGAATLQR